MDVEHSVSGDGAFERQLLSILLSQFFDLPKQSQKNLFHFILSLDDAQPVDDAFVELQLKDKRSVFDN